MNVTGVTHAPPAPALLLPPAPPAPPPELALELAAVDEELAVLEPTDEAAVELAVEDALEAELELDAELEVVVDDAMESLHAMGAIRSKTKAKRM